MDPFEPILDDRFRKYADLQFRRNALLTEGEGHEAEIDALEDRMTELWDNLDDTQRQSLNGMASDLNWLRRTGQLAPQGRRAEHVSLNEQHELASARQAKQWHKFLHYLRICSPCMPAATVAWLRGRAYAAIELNLYSICFYEMAANLESANKMIAQSALLAIDRMDHCRALSRAEQILESPVRFPPAVVALSAVMILRNDAAEGHGVDKERFQAILEQAIERLELEPLSNVEKAVVYKLAAEAFETIDDPHAALNCYDEGLRLSPDDDVLLIGKGMLLYGSRTDEAVVAFRRLISNEGTLLVWPYFFLAHYFLLRRQYDDALDMAKQAWERATTNPIRAELLEWQAICLSESDYPPALVRTCFEQAQALDPSNQRIQLNATAFISALSAGQPPKWEIEAEEKLRLESAANAIGFELLAVA